MLTFTTINMAAHHQEEGPSRSQLDTVRVSRNARLTLHVELQSLNVTQMLPQSESKGIRNTYRNDDYGGDLIRKLTWAHVWCM